MLFRSPISVDPILRRLHDDRIGHAVLRVQPEGRRGLDAAGEVVQHAGREVTLGQPHLAREGAVDVDIQGRCVERLLDARIGDARHLADALQQLVGIGAVGLQIVADHLHIDRRRQAEVQDLGDDVGRQEGEGRAGEQPRQPLTQRVDVAVGRMVVRLQRNQDIARRWRRWCRSCRMPC